MVGILFARGLHDDMGSPYSLGMEPDVVFPCPVEELVILLVVATDDDQDVNEVSDEGNNLAAAAIVVDLAPFADLQVSQVGVSGRTFPGVFVGDPVSMTVDWTVTNLGTGAGLRDTWVDRIVASTDNVLGDMDDRLLAEFRRQIE